MHKIWNEERKVLFLKRFIKQLMWPEQLEKIKLTKAGNQAENLDYLYRLLELEA